ncbi:MAG: UDP-N-acetylmuramoyl-tripeptide--D-alanyl-D-alanine ligase [Syntrophomonadaceae bacterium]|nr:UDP-N-acetylmuramoyl-tripeptide--D-alanyl-D-alanine ligase [Syntrophomonadaceae bacterium]
MKMTIDFILESTKGTLISGNRADTIEGISIDTRSLAPGQLFFALTGENGDGHDFIEQALAAGATGVVVSRAETAAAMASRGTVILVDNTLAALQALAGSYRQLFRIPMVAVTGSVGKTTTKEILAGCLGIAHKTLKTPGNYNNEIGLPLTLLGLEPDHGAAVVELAMRAPGEIAFLAGIVKPSVAIITNIAPVHLETMGSMENIAKAKCEVLEYIIPGGFAMINGDHRLLLEAAKRYNCRRFTFGYDEGCDFQILAAEIAGKGANLRLRLLDSAWTFHLPTPATRLAPDAAAAIATAYLLGQNIQEIQAGLDTYLPGPHRLNLIDLPGGGLIIDDSYNANPISMQAALEVCRDMSRGRRTIAVLGDMAELGEYEPTGHKEVGRSAAVAGIDLLLTVGPRAELIAEGARQAGMPGSRVTHYPTREECAKVFGTLVTQQDVVLFKASRSMKLEDLVDDFKQVAFGSKVDNV